LKIPVSAVRFRPRPPYFKRFARSARLKTSGFAKNSALLAVLSLAAGLLAGMALARPTPEPGAPFRPQTDLGTLYIGLLQQYHRVADPQQPDGAVIFLGDSLTQGLAVAAVSPRAVNYGVAGATSADVLRAVPQLGSLKRARVVAVMVGTNDVGKQQTAGIEDRLRAISAAIPVPLVWTEIPPHAEGDVSSVNAAAAKVCAERPDCTFLRMRWGPADMDPDGVHLSPEGRARWMRALSDAAH
jgi:hypothetical protein